MTAIRPTCSTCAFFDASSANQAVCKANPPTVSFLALPGRSASFGGSMIEIKPVTGWPPVPGTQWCGKWQGKLVLVGN
jgi:hypothetical protein